METLALGKWGDALCVLLLLFSVIFRVNFEAILQCLKGYIIVCQIDIKGR